MRNVIFKTHAISSQPFLLIEGKYRGYELKKLLAFMDPTMADH